LLLHSYPSSGNFLAAKMKFFRGPIAPALIGFTMLIGLESALSISRTTLVRAPLLGATEAGVADAPGPMGPEGISIARSGPESRFDDGVTGNSDADPGAWMRMAVGGKPVALLDDRAFFNASSFYPARFAPMSVESDSSSTVVAGDYQAGENHASPPASQGSAIAQQSATQPDPESVPANRYRIREGDLVDVYVWGQDNISGKFRVARDGTITVRLAGTLEVLGITTSQAAALISESLRPYLVLPAVTVSVAEASGRDILLVGEVDAPGIYPLERPMTVLELLIRAKYKAPSADLSSVTIIRDKKPIKLNLSAILRGDRVEENLELASGDIVVVPGREVAIGIHGAALKPGRYRFERDRTVSIRDLLIEGSMWTTRANLSAAFVLREDGSLERVDVNALWFRGDVAHDRVLRNGDALVLPEVPDVGVYVLGKVARPGLHQMSGTPNVLQALSLAQPDNFAARLYDARLVRGWPTNPRVLPLNLQAVLEGDLSQNITLQHGDVIYVPETALSYTLEFWNKLLTPISGTASAVKSLEGD
jgi:polysaccharide export outer membrane protein